MRNWTGAALFAIGAWLIFSALAQRGRVLTTRRKSEAQEVIPTNSSLIALGDIFRPLVIIGLIYFAVKVTLAYVLLDGNRIFSLFDLSGLLFLLAAYAIWLIVKTKYREAIGPGAVSVPPLAAPVAVSVDDTMASPTPTRSEVRERELVS
jgi:hypothetical protein